VLLRAILWLPKQLRLRLRKELRLRAIVLCTELLQQLWLQPLLLARQPLWHVPLPQLRLLRTFLLLRT
jgi:hypothetical protein